MEFLLYNGQIIRKDSFFISTQNRAFRYGDSVFESMFASQLVLPFFDLHFNRLVLAMRTLQFENIDGFKANKPKLYNDIHKLLIRNKLYKGVRIRLTVYRKEGGLYTPVTNDFDYLVETEKLTSDFYLINTRGYKIGNNPEYGHPCRTSFFKSGNSLQHVMAALYAKKNSLDDCLIFNTQDQVMEATSSNIFLLNNGVLFTPRLQTGCVDGVMRRVIIELAREINIPVFDDVILEEIDLFSADEMFLTNATSGLRWVVAYENKRYFNKFSIAMTEKLNSKVKKLISNAEKK